MNEDKRVDAQSEIWLMCQAISEAENCYEWSMEGRCPNGIRFLLHRVQFNKLWNKCFKPHLLEALREYRDELEKIANGD